MNKNYGNLVRLLDIDKDFIIDLRYATTNNFTNSKIYNSNECYIDKNTAKLLLNAKNIFKSDGYKVVVWDAYRPVSAQQKFWDLVQDNNYVAYPPDLSKKIEFKNSHMNGQCIDITLADNMGKYIPMPSNFDDFTDFSRIDCKRINPVARKNAEYLRDVMISCGFSPYEGEWWHFYDKTTKPTPYSNHVF